LLNSRTRIAVIAGFIALSLGVWGIRAFTTQDSQSTDIVAPATFGLLENKMAEQGELAPDFRLNDLNLEPLQLSELRGTPVVMNFFASWCAPCKVELPFLKAAYEQSDARGYVVLGVSNHDRREAMEAFAIDENLGYPIVIDGDNTVGVAYQVVGPPYTYFIDRDGVIDAVISGELDEDTLQENLAAILD
jgi:cytochrome c biogenesis protein CcmG/thiol:disulfide interchange protein DsbE